MKINPAGRFGFLQIRALVALLLFGAAICLAKLSLAPSRIANWDRERRDVDRPRYMPVSGERGEAEDLNRLEEEWNNRLTYPTGIFNPDWLRQAAQADSLITSAIPAGVPLAETLKNTGIELTPLALSSGGFTALGPAPLHMTGCFLCYDYVKSEGRVNAIAVDPTTTTNGSIVAYLASVGGGVWKTTNCCSSSTTWSVTTDDPLLATISVDTLAIDPNNHNTIYAGTGDLNYGSFSMGSQGILKSIDAGAHWTVLGANVFGPSLFFQTGQFPQYQAVGKVRVDPNNSNNVVAGTKTGLYFSYDAGNNWTGPCTTNSFSSQRQDITGLELSNIGGTTRILAAVGVRGISTTVQYNLNQNGANGIYKANMPASGCPAANDWMPITTNANGWKIGTTNMNATSGVPCNLPITGGTVCTNPNPNKLGRIDIAVAPSNPDVIYAQVQAIESQSSCGGTGCQLAAWRSTNGGSTWIQIPGSTGASLRDCGGSAGDYAQNWYDQGVAVDPNNSDRVFFDTFEIWFWKNGNTSWTDTTCGYSGNQEIVHVDQHALAFVPGSSSILLAGSDGGVYATTNANGTNGPTHTQWFNMDNGLNTIEFYSGDISANFATSSAPMANGGSQDNGSMSVTFSGSPTGPVQWQMGAGGDGFYGRIDPVGNRFWQGNNGGQLNYCDHAPPVSDCTAPDAVWALDSSPWTNNVASPDIQSFVLPYEIFKGTPDNLATDCPLSGCGHLIVGTQRVWETTTAGNAWAPVSMNLVKGTLGNRSFINQLAFAPKDQTRAVVGTNDGNVQYGHGLGVGAIALWVNLTDGNAILPNRPILDVAMDPNATTMPIAYAAVGGFNANTPSTPGHVFRVVCGTDCATFTWADKSGNLPDIPVDSIIANPKFPQQVFAGTDWGLYYTNDITAASPIWYRFDNGLPHAMIWDMQIDRGNTTLSVWTRSRGAYVWPLSSAPLLGLTKVESRMTHGSAGEFNLDITNGNAIECRSGGVNNSYKIVFTFSNALNSCGVASAGTVTPGPDSNQCSVDVSVATGNYVTVQLTGVTDANTNVGNFSATMGVLVGDTSSNAAVNSSDVTQTQSQSGQVLTDDNFREDVTVNGSINSSDVTLVQSQSGRALPSPPAPSAAATSPTPAPTNTAPGDTKGSPAKTKPRKNSSRSGQSR